MMLLSYLVKKGDEFYWKMFKLIAAVISYSSFLLLLWVNT
ncbi:hypothetical protein SAMN04488029_1497 [Reichenbachiella faecimaris]|uniref:Uncharacterized protein n=1 Tax=Reichenbachiella faecimaris TaxID=692418 RepID=A0A1W2G9I5_REIFA|nr:hypothetical protein SAMN04488029_1497 [Reichenbachiella faecimaris]